MLSWFDLLLLCTGHTHIHCDGTKARAWSAAAVVPVLLLYGVRESGANTKGSGLYIKEVGFSTHPLGSSSEGERNP